MNGFFHSFPFAKGNFLRDYFNPSLEKRGEGEIFGPTDADIIHRISDTPR